MKKNRTWMKKICLVAGGVLLAGALIIAGLHLRSLYLEKRYPANMVAPYLMLKGNLYVESSDLVGIIPQAERERYGFENIGTIQRSVPHSQLPTEDFTSNFDCVGAEVHLSNDANHAYLKVEKGFLRFDLWENDTVAPYDFTTRPSS